ncbi:hypothetical protein N7517_008017 [Penicillium concentricum]|uniref:Cytochrome P450 n=1 Tax=Penicillium concentricum TaxID=293559 RepID=A0A9W9RRN5_9EURO|nr:uncharacterized protein N7517_008017 [Penicillium concentricum]KAJ5365131.1 hypothetical protein N7517_008017 [Penicillium concentricum]
MGAKVAWRGQDFKKLEPGCETTYIEASKVVMGAVTGSIVIPNSVLLNWPFWFPGHQKLKQLGIKKRESSMHTKHLLHQERQYTFKHKTTQSNSMSQLLQAHLSEEELNGNLFLITAAGFETTANTISYAIMLLVRNPRWQE